ncbi:MAG: hypothetical protein HYZ27_09080 [Deltaproteobacteria bacterium]|nr:hypothetical protein [Deltaproteobacteria bacterium]
MREPGVAVIVALDADSNEVDRVAAHAFVAESLRLWGDTELCEGEGSIFGDCVDLQAADGRLLSGMFSTVWEVDDNMVVQAGAFSFTPCSNVTGLSIGSTTLTVRVLELDLEGSFVLNVVECP